ncbi:hypothetical protein M9Y10_038243 [Tritrichomonas musculus]|uniref:Protein kinase domain-containing protein n=1 Tax=Tritrichomonas musculus TaxID=1915356 RepID=A0ABR2K7V4_9EUKA
MSIERGIDTFVLDTSMLKIVSDKPIGSGGYANVYLVKDQDDNEYVAKVGKEQFKDHVEEKNYIRELMILSKVNNPCTIGLKGFSFSPRFDGDGEVDYENDTRLIKNPTVILEKASGGSIRSKLERIQKKKKCVKWTPTKRMIALAGTAFGMKYLHSKHIIHRDLKPENVLLNDDLHPKITDFGLSKIQYDNKQTISGTGTQMYMAPEMFQEGDFTNSVDVYAFGILAYEVITLNLPYNPKDFQNIFRFQKQIVEGKRPEFPPGVNPLLQELVCKCWDKCDMERPTFSEIFECLSKPEFLISDVDLDEYNAYLNSLQEDKDSLCLDPEVQTIVNQANKGDVQKMKEAAEGFYDGKGMFPVDKDQALKFYRMYSISMDRLQKNQESNDNQEKIHEDEVPEKIQEEEAPEKIQEDEVPEKIQEEEAPEKIQEEEAPEKIQEEEAPEKIQEDKSNDNEEEKITLSLAGISYYSSQGQLVLVNDDDLIEQLSSEVKDIINSKSSSQDLFELAANFKEGKSPFPQDFQLSSYFFSKAFEALNNNVDNSNDNNNDKISKHHKKKESDIPLDKKNSSIRKKFATEYTPQTKKHKKRKSNLDDDDDGGDNEKPRPSSLRVRDRSSTVDPSSMAKLLPIDLTPICIEALKNQVIHINIIIFGSKNSVSPFLKALFTEQNTSPIECENQYFLCTRIHGKSISVYHIKDDENVDYEEMLNFVKDRTSSVCDPSNKLFMCLYCISPSHDSEDINLIQQLSKMLYTAIFVTSIDKSSSLDKFKKSIKGKIYRKDDNPDSEKLKKSPLIFDLKLTKNNSHSDLLQDFINIVPNLSIIGNTE